MNDIAPEIFLSILWPRFFAMEAGFPWYDREAEEIHVREEDRNGRDQAEHDEQGENRNLQEEQEKGGDGGGDHCAHRGERRVHPSDREIFFRPELDVRPQEALLEVRVLFPPGLHELPEHAPRDLLLRRQAHADGLRALRQLHHVVRLFRLFSWSEPLRLRERPARLELLECAATQPSHLQLRRPSGFRLPAVPSPRGPVSRSEERRVGKECRSRWSPYH